MSAKGRMIKSVSLTPAAFEYASQIGNFSGWVNSQLLKHKEQSVSKAIHSTNHVAMRDSVKTCWPFSSKGCCVLCWPDGPPRRDAWMRFLAGEIEKPEGLGWDEGGDLTAPPQPTQDEGEQAISRDSGNFRGFKAKIKRLLRL